MSKDLLWALDPSTGLPVPIISAPTSDGNNAVLVVFKDGAGNGVMPSDYDGDKVTSTASTREAIPSGSNSLWISNESVTTAESVRFRFGDSTVVAIATAGYRVSPGQISAWQSSCLLM